MQKNVWRQRLGYGVGTLGRDFVATMVSMYLMFYMTEVINVSTSTLAYVSGIMIFMRAFDGLNDPIMGSIVDNTSTRFGKFKPWMFVGAILWAISHVLMFSDTGLQGMAFVIFFFIIYLLWEVSYTMNDIAYWSMIPSLSRDQKEKEKIGSWARIFASIGMFSFVTLIIPVSKHLTALTGSGIKAWFFIALVQRYLCWCFKQLH